MKPFTNTFLSILLLFAFSGPLLAQKSTSKPGTPAKQKLHAVAKKLEHERDIQRKTLKKLVNPNEKKLVRMMIRLNTIELLLIKGRKPSKADVDRRTELIQEIDDMIYTVEDQNDGPSGLQIDCAKRCWADRIQCFSACPQEDWSNPAWLNCWTDCMKGYEGCCHSCGNNMCWGITNP